MKMKQLWIGKACGLVLAVVSRSRLDDTGAGLGQVSRKADHDHLSVGTRRNDRHRVPGLRQNLSRVWGVNVNVVNKPGGNTVIGTMELNNSKPDGYTVMMDNRDSTSLPYVSDNLPFKILDRTWMNEIAYTPYLLTVPANSKFQNLKDIVAAIKSDPKRFRVPSLGGAGTQDFFGRQFLKAIGVEYKDVSLVMGKSGNDIMIFTAQGSVDIGQVGAAAAKPQLDAKTVRPIAIAGTGGKRLDWLPNVRPSMNSVTRRSMPSSGSGCRVLLACRNRLWKRGTRRCASLWSRTRNSSRISTRSASSPNGGTRRRSSSTSKSSSRSPASCGGQNRVVGGFSRSLDRLKPLSIPRVLGRRDGLAPNETGFSKQPLLV